MSSPEWQDNLYVAEGEHLVPFLRGMITHSLMERGLTFEEAYETASQVRDHIREQRVIQKDELAALIEKLLREKLGKRYSLLTPHGVRFSPAIKVTGEGEDVPFSKGILSQSLQASGLEPSVSYDIAREIEAVLVRRNQQEIHRDELRRLIYDTIRLNYDLRFAERYLLWRCFKTPDKPLIILFGGATGTGKSSVATEVAHRLGIQKILSTDTVRQIMRMMFSRDLLPAIYSSSYDAWKERRLGEDKSVAIIEAFQEQSLRVLVGVRAMVERAIEENFSIVMDGVHLVPGLTGLNAFEDKAYIVPLVISTTNQDSYLNRFPERQRGAMRRSARRYMENFEAILKIQAYILEMAKQYSVPVIENENFDDAVLTILTVIAEQLQNKLRIDSANLVSRAL
ncbi:MAG: hypothetical protein HY645_06105 [Acidobacteria bacterium]|nr:hypothetical protein [Acidobacteriota bacterium]